MSSLSRTMARASKRGLRLMEQHQGPGAYQEAERRYNEARLAQRAEQAKKRDNHG